MIDNLCKAVIAQTRTTCFVETGLYQAETVAEVSIWFAEMYPSFGVITHLVQYGIKAMNPWNSYISYPVFRAVNANDFWAPTCKLYSIDMHLPFVENARAIFSTNPNIQFVHDSSEKALARMVASGEIRAEQTPFVYLDAHWFDYWPLRDELDVLLKLDKVIVVVDDFEVPGRPEWGFDMYKGQPCGVPVIRDLILGNPPVSVFFPVRSNRDNRGWIMMFKGFAEHELQFLARLPLFRFAVS